MPENRLDYHSSEIQDIMGKIPGWTLRWGLIIITAIFIGVCTACYFIKYPQIVPTTIELTSYNPPVELMSHSTGKIAKLFVANGDIVVKNANILVLESTAYYDDVMAVNDKFVNNSQEWEQFVSDDELYKSRRLGDIQTIFLQFQKRCAAFKTYLKTALLEKKRELLKIQITKQIELLNNQNKQKNLMIQDYDLSVKDFRRDSTMVTVDGLSIADYEKRKQGILQKESSLIGFKSSIHSTEVTILSLKENMVEVDIQLETELQNFYVDMNELRQQLKTQIERWKNDYLVTSPIVGEVLLTKFWSENQNITTSDKVATILPQDSAMILGRAFVPYSGYAKVKEGQEVNVKLDSYPYMEYGSIKGVVKSVSPVPEKDGYAVEIAFPEGLNSSYGKSLEYAHQMTGTADIITKDMRLIEQFIQPMRAIWDKLKL